MKRSLAAATLAGALMLAPMATAAATAEAEPAAPVSGCATIPPGGCSWFHELGNLLSAGSSALSSGSKAKS
ncbi:hypothetical protein AB0H76_01080 [Nocardia sp. NPDC050712]|uniref:hypothetical protein n=1 Tax=Nocardia sp. NPDC050712 TaxID=3155518 RepID=UPI00340B36AA